MSLLTFDNFVRYNQVNLNNLKMRLLFSFLMLCFINISCSEKECCDTIPKSLNCDQNIIANQNLYNIGLIDPSTIINDVTLNENCLEVSFSYSGGCQDHQIDLVWQGEGSSVFNPWITLRVKHDNMDLCEAYITETRSFDLNSIKEAPFNIKIEGWDELIKYE